MVSYVAALMAQDVMRQQFQTGTLRRQEEAPKLRWRISVTVWTLPVAAALRAAADRLEGMEQVGCA
jgi:hypothetical protein